MRCRHVIRDACRAQRHIPTALVALIQLDLQDLERTATLSRTAQRCVVTGGSISTALHNRRVETDDPSATGARSHSVVGLGLSARCNCCVPEYAESSLDFSRIRHSTCIAAGGWPAFVLSATCRDRRKPRADIRCACCGARHLSSVFEFEALLVKRCTMIRRDGSAASSQGGRDGSFPLTRAMSATNADGESGEDAVGTNSLEGA